MLFCSRKTIIDHDAVRQQFPVLPGDLCLSGNGDNDRSLACRELDACCFANTGGDEASLYGVIQIGVAGCSRKADRYFPCIGVRIVDQIRRVLGIVTPFIPYL